MKYFGKIENNIDFIDRHHARMALVERGESQLSNNAGDEYKLIL